MIRTRGDNHVIAPPKRLTKAPKLAIQLEPEQYDALKKLVKRRRDLGENPTVFVRQMILASLQHPDLALRLILTALQKHQPLKKG
jgi:hypothetical protein